MFCQQLQHLTWTLSQGQRYPQLNRSSQKNGGPWVVLPRNGNENTSLAWTVPRWTDFIVKNKCRFLPVYYVGRAAFKHHGSWRNTNAYESKCSELGLSVLSIILKNRLIGLLASCNHLISSYQVFIVSLRPFFAVWHQTWVLYSKMHLATVFAAN